MFQCDGKGISYTWSNWFFNWIAESIKCLLGDSNCATNKVHQSRCHYNLQKHFCSSISLWESIPAKSLKRFFGDELVVFIKEKKKTGYLLSFRTKIKFNLNQIGLNVKCNDPQNLFCSLVPIHKWIFYMWK